VGKADFFFPFAVISYELLFFLTFPAEIFNSRSVSFFSNKKMYKKRTPTVKSFFFNSKVWALAHFLLLPSLKRR